MRLSSEVISSFFYKISFLDNKTAEGVPSPGHELPQQEPWLGGWVGGSLQLPMDADVFGSGVGEPAL